MTLIKKTIILTSQETQGYCTIIRVGSEIGAKIVGAKFTQSMRVGIKIGTQPIYTSMIQGAKTEIDLPLNFTQNDSIGCLVVDGDTIFAKGGVYISKDDVYINTSNEETTEVVAIPKKITNKVVVNEKVAEATKLAEAMQVTEAMEEAVIEEDNDILQRLGGENSNFYASAKDRIDELFIIYPPDKNLDSLIPDSKWVKISYDGEDYYVVGQLLNEGKLNYIGYGVPGIKAIQPPKITEGYADWLPVNDIKPYDGYWLIFQNAENGKMSNL